tara:strand:- start:113 stop:382 length:270 start_codon:yes stop_codon:yes gene_type:complete
MAMIHRRCQHRLCVFPGLDLIDFRHRYAKAQYNLGLLYDNGEGVPENDVEAVQWYWLAAQQGDAGAQNNLGLMYGNGEGVPSNDIKAYA